MQRFLCIAVTIIAAVSMAARADVAEILAEADSCHDAYNDTRAATLYANALEEGPSSYEAAWKLARTTIDLGKRARDKAGRKRLYLKGEQHAKKAIALNPGGAKGYLQYGIALGRVALDTTAKEKVRMAKEIRTAFEKSLSLDPREDFALHALGRWHREMATLGWLEKTFADMFLGGIPKDVSVDRAAEYFRKAIAIRPSHINHHLELAMTLELLKKTGEAISEYEKVLSLPKSHADDDEYKRRARERLAALKK